MKKCSDKNEHAKTQELQKLEDRVQQGNSWYVGDQFAEQLGKPGTRVIIEERWKHFADIFIDYLQNRVSHDSTRPLRYLDAGCGDGINLQWASSFFQQRSVDVRLTALDYNALRVERVVKKNIAKETLVASLIEIPFGDSSFDIVFCNHVIEHIEQYPKALIEIFRILSPGGLLLIGAPNEGCLFGWLRNRVIQRSILKKTDHVNFFNSTTLSEALQKAGFNVVRVCRDSFLFPHFWVHYGLTYFTWGGRLLSLLGRIIPSQSGGLIVYAVKPE